MSTQHTPGPWTFDKDNEEITCEKRQGMAAIATVETGWAEPFESEQQANARLIAAAPDLLAECKLALLTYRTLLQHATGHTTDKTVRGLENVIAKATGGDA